MDADLMHELDLARDMGVLPSERDDRTYAGGLEIDQKKDVLILIDIQHDFVPGGNLAVPKGDRIMPEVKDLAESFDNIVLTQDWHPRNHSSFASNHEEAGVFDRVEMPYGEQVLWPDHCIQGSRGAGFYLPVWIQDKAQLIIRKGYNPDIDSYSAFKENDKQTHTGLAGFMVMRGYERAFFAGLALDYCVFYSAVDAADMGLTSVVVKGACKAMDDEIADDQLAEAAQRFGDRFLVV